MERQVTPRQRNRLKYFSRRGTECLEREVKHGRVVKNRGTAPYRSLVTYIPRSVVVLQKIGCDVKLVCNKRATNKCST